MASEEIEAPTHHEGRHHEPTVKLDKGERLADLKRHKTAVAIGIAGIILTVILYMLSKRSSSSSSTGSSSSPLVAPSSGPGVSVPLGGGGGSSAPSSSTGSSSSGPSVTTGPPASGSTAALGGLIAQQGKTLTALTTDLADLTAKISAIQTNAAKAPAAAASSSGSTQPTGGGKSTSGLGATGATGAGSHLPAYTPPPPPGQAVASLSPSATATITAALGSGSGGGSSVNQAVDALGGYGAGSQGPQLVHSWSTAKSILASGGTLRTASGQVVTKANVHTLKRGTALFAG